MSICRFSTDDFQCDLYIYEDIAGCITVHTAHSHTGRPIFLDDDVLRTVAEIVHSSTPIQDPRAGKTFHCNGEEAVALVKDLRAAGFAFPDYVLDVLEAIKGDYP